MIDLLKFLFKKKKIDEIIINNKIKLFLILFCVNILIMFLSRVIFIELEDLGLINKVNNNKKISYTGFNLLFISGFLIPITEEVISRLWLKFNIYYLPISLSLFAFLFSFVFIFGNEINRLFLLPIEIFKCLLISVLIFVLVLKIVLKNINKLTLIFKKYILGIVYFSSLTFSLLHLSMYNFEAKSSISFLPFFLFPYFIAGVLLSYIRLKLSFLAVILFHILHNSLFIGLKIILLK